MKEKKWIAVKIEKSFFIVHIVTKSGVHKIQRYSLKKSGISEFMKELDYDTVINIEKNDNIQKFIEKIKGLIKDCSVLNKLELLEFNGYFDESNMDAAYDIESKITDNIETENQVSLK